MTRGGPMRHGEHERRTTARLLKVKQKLVRTDRAEAKADEITASRLLHIQRLLKLAGRADVENDSTTPIACVRCGYNQRHLASDRCPECGLHLAALYRDPTPWGRSAASLRNWWTTAVQVWSWDHRVRVRTALVPTTTAARGFARWSVLLTAVLAGLCVVLASPATSGPSFAVFSHQLSQFLVGTVLAALLLTVAQYGLACLLRIRWRQFQVVPGSAYYCTAWWPQTVTAVLLFVALTPLHPALPWAAAISGFLGALVWGLWLWSGLVETDRISAPALRIAAVALLGTVSGTALLAMTPGVARSITTKALTVADAGLARVDMFGAAPPLTLVGPRTSAVFVDMIPSDEEHLIKHALTGLGADREARVVMGNRGATLARIRKAFASLREELGFEDRFIFYINGHGSRHGSGTIRVADGELTSQQLVDLVKDLPTPHVLIVIDSCFGGKFVSALRDCDAIVIASTDDSNVGFKSGLRLFWEALLDPASDEDLDNKVTVEEAFWGAYRSMLAEAEKRRQRLLSHCPRARKRYENVSHVTPQLDVFGEANADDFAIKVSPVGPDPSE